jgi:hypothetical protein
MKNFVLSCIGLFFALILNTQTLKASHILGGDLTYKRITADSFLISLKVFRDCNGIQVSGGPITISSSCGTRSINLTQISVTDITGIPQNCSTKSRCSGSFAYGFQECLYQAGVSFAGDTCCKHTIGWTECCRTSGITTGPSGSIFYIETTIDRCITNSSPVFDLFPRMLTEVGTDVSLSFHATDPENDLITYELTPALIASGTNVSYTGSYSATKPIKFSNFPYPNYSYPNGLSFDSLTGNLMFKPVTSNEIGVIAVKAIEWRVIGGVLTKIGETTREQVLIVKTATSNHKPTFGNYNSRVFAACIDTGTFCIDINITDADNNDTVKLTYQHNVSNITFTNIGSPNKPVVRVCYVPDSTNYIRPGTQFFTISASDGVCTFPGMTDRTFSINVTSNMPDSFHINKNLVCNSLNLQLGNPTTIKNAVTRWQIKSSANTFTKDSSAFLQELTDTGWHFIQMRVSAPYHCDSVYYYDSVYIAPTNYIKINMPADTSVCFDSAFTFSPTINNGAAPYKYLWNTNDTTLTLTVNLHKGKNVFSLTVTDTNLCFANSIMKVGYFNPTATIVADTARCINDTITLKVLLKDTLKPAYQWVGFTAKKPIIKDTLTATKQYTFMLTDSAGCVVNKMHTVTVYAPKITMRRIAKSCLFDSLYLWASASGGLAPYNYLWYPYSLTGDSVVSPPLSRTGLEIIRVQVTDAFGCRVSKEDTLTINALPTISLSSPGPLCTSATSVNLTPFAWPTGGVWSGTAVTSPVLNTLNSGGGTFALKYDYTDSTTGCSNIDSMTVKVYHPQVAISHNPSACANDSIMLTGIASSGLPPYNMVWQPYTLSGSSITAPPANIAGFANFSVTITDSAGCQNTFTDSIAITPLPVITFSPSPVCESIGTVSLTGFVNPIGGMWSGAGVNANTFNTINSGTGSFMLQYAYTDSASGCTNTDSLGLTVYRPQISVAHKPYFCLYDSIKLYATANGGIAPYGFAWNPSSLNGDSITFPPTFAAGYANYAVTVTDSAGCQNTHTDSVIINTSPTVTISPISAVCSDDAPVSLSGYGNPAGGHWIDSTAITNDVFYPAVSGAGKFKVYYYFFDSSGCGNYDSSYLTVNLQPKASFIVDSTVAQLNHTFRFTNTSVYGAGDSFRWNFGDPNSGTSNTDTATNPTHTFTDTGWYNIQLTIPPNLCMADTVIKSNYIYVYLYYSNVSVKKIANNKLLLYPNPAKNTVTLETDFDIKAVKITDITGRVFTVAVYYEGTKAIINLENIDAGTYIINAESIEGKTITTPLIIAK